MSKNQPPEIHRCVGAQRVAVPHPLLQAGNRCPECQNDKARLGPRPPARIVRISAPPMFLARIFDWQQLRCNLCGKLYTAPAPPAAGISKYDPNVGVMLGLLRFGGGLPADWQAGLPHYRLEKMQRDLGVPLPAATQWELMEETARALEPIHRELITVAAQGQLFHNDDTTRRVQSLKQQRTQSASERTGIFTTSILSKVGDHQVALFWTGANHAGENLDERLKNRAQGLDQPIQNRSSPTRAWARPSGTCSTMGSR